jgi:hypothetical protein
MRLYPYEPRWNAGAPWSIADESRCTCRSSPSLRVKAKSPRCDASRSTAHRARQVIRFRRGARGSCRRLGADRFITFKRALRPYVEYVQSGANGFVSSTLDISDGFELSIYTG